MSGRLGKTKHSTHEKESLLSEIKHFFGFGGRGESSTRSENFGETAGARDLGFQPLGEALEQSYYDLQTENAKLRDDLGARDTELRKKDGDHARRIAELNERMVELKKLRKNSQSLHATILAMEEENKSLEMAISGLQKENRAFKTAVADRQKEKVSLNTKITGLQKENGSLNRAIAEFQEEKRLLGECVRKLKGENENVRRRNEELRSCATRLEQALREVQEREYAAAKHQDIESHEVVSAQFENLFRLCGDWARRYFKLGMGDFRVEEFPLFARELGLVSWSGVNWRDKKHLKVSHLVQAVLGNILVREVFKCPFAGCAKDFRLEFGHLYEVKLRVEGEPAAHRWRASSLATYHECQNWPPIDGQPVETYRADNLVKVGRLLWEVLSPITSTHFQDRAAEESGPRKDQIVAIIRGAMALAAKMSQQASKLVIIDKEWFQNNGRQIGRNDDRVKDRLGDGDEIPGADLTVDLILTPGFLKHGDDDAEHFDRYSVWMPAKVDLRDPRGGNPPPTREETQANERVEEGTVRTSHQAHRRAPKKI